MVDLRKKSFPPFAFFFLQLLAFLGALFLTLFIFHAETDDAGDSVQIRLWEEDGEHFVELGVVTDSHGPGLLGLHDAVLVEQSHLGVQKLCGMK